MLRTLLLGFLITATLGSDVHAAGNAQTACRADFLKFCKGTQLGGGRGAQCLGQHKAELTPACQATMEVVGGCGAQIKKICGTQGAGKELKKCVEDHKSEFSETCKAAIPTR